jgi:hypothetical protein
MKRLCFLLCDVAHARNAVEVLRAAHIGDSNIMIVAKHDTPLGDLPAANVDATDAMPGLERGLAGGAVLGALAGILIMRFTALGVILGGAAIPWFTLFGAGLSGFMTLLAGAAFPSSRLKPFETAIEAGRILLMVDVANSRAQDVERLVRSECPTAEFTGFEPRAPLVPP